MTMNKIQTVIILLASLIISSSCQSRGEDSSENENVSRLSVQFGAKADLTLVNSNNVYVKFGHKSFEIQNLSEFINRNGTHGWTSKFEFPSSGILTGVACQEPNLIGFTDIDISEAPEIKKYLDLRKATELELKILEPRNSLYEPKEFELMPHSKFGVYSKGKRYQIEGLCSVRFSHFPEKDFAPYFEISETDMIMKEERRSIFDLDLFNSKVSETKVTIMGVARIDGHRVGFIATEDIEVDYN